jgi:hypothetical protein
MPNLLVANESKADLIAFKTDQDYKADLDVFVVNQEYKAKNDALWFFVEQEHKAKWLKPNKFQNRV